MFQVDAVNLLEKTIENDVTQEVDACANMD